MGWRRELKAYATETRPRHAAVNRVTGEVYASRDARTLRRPRRTPAFALGLAGGALAAILAVVLHVALGPVLPGPDADPLRLVSEDGWQTLAPTRHVALDYQGKGAIRGTAEAPRLEWTSGTVRAEVEPGRGIELQVRTPEATVQVIGTVFEVERGAPGTTVSVARGRVKVECDLGTSALLQRGQRHTCLPTTAAGLLGRARHLQRSGAPPAETLTAIELGLGRPGNDAVHFELRYVKVLVLAESGRRKAALRQASALLARGAGHRTDELEELVLELRSRRGR